MKAGDFVMVLLMVGLVVTLFGIMITGFEEAYIDTGISPTSPLNATYTQGFVNATEVNKTFSPLLDDLSAIGGGGGFTTVVSGLYALPQVMLHLPEVFFTFMGSMKESILTFLQVVGIPVEIIIFLSIIISIIVIFKFIEMFAGRPV